MRPRKKFHIIIPLLALFAVGAAILYIRVIEFTVSTRALLVEEMGRAVNKKAFARSVRFDLIKGLVLDGVVIYDDKHVIVRFLPPLKEVSPSGLADMMMQAINGNPSLWFWWRRLGKIKRGERRH